MLSKQELQNRETQFFETSPISAADAADFCRRLTDSLHRAVFVTRILYLTLLQIATIFVKIFFYVNQKHIANPYFSKMSMNILLQFMFF